MIASSSRYWPSIAAVVAIGGFAWLSERSVRSSHGAPDAVDDESRLASASAERLGQQVDAALEALLAAEPVARLESGLDWDLTALSGSSELCSLELDASGARLREVGATSISGLSDALRDFQDHHRPAEREPRDARVLVRWSSIPAGLHLVLFTTRGTRPCLFYFFDSSARFDAPLVRDDGWSVLVHGAGGDARSARHGWSCYVLDERVRARAVVTLALRSATPFVSLELAYGP